MPEQLQQKFSMQKKNNFSDSNRSTIKTLKTTRKSCHFLFIYMDLVEFCFSVRRALRSGWI